jgi:hypothetical protein
MSEDGVVYGSQELAEYEWQLVDKIKETMKVLARVVKHLDPKVVKKDIDPHEEMEKEELDELVEKHLTPDLPGLNVNEEAFVVGQLGPVIFARLMALESGQPDDPDDEPD